MIFGIKLLGSFLMAAVYSFLKYYATDRPAVATLKIYISGFDRLCATHFWPFFGFWSIHWEPLGDINLPIVVLSCSNK